MKGGGRGGGQAQAAERAAGATPTIIRNSGGGGSRDVHLENFNLSNGGQDLLEVRCIPTPPLPSIVPYMM